MASHPLYCALRINGAWQDVSADVHQGSAVRVTRGAKDESGGLTPSKAELRLLDLAAAAPAYDPDHPLSPWYGLAGQNTRMIVGRDIATETFESATPAVARADAGTAFWTRSTTDAHTGTWSLKAGTVGNSQVSDVTFTVPAGANAIVFWYKISSQDPGDGLQIMLDAGPGLSLNEAGITAWKQLALKVTPGGTIRFRYTKDASGSAGSDTAWIDDLKFYASWNVVETSSWSPDEEPGFRPQAPGPAKAVRWTDLQGEGILRRIGQWKDAVRSPVYRQIASRVSSGRLLGYWPMEDADGASALTNVLPAGPTGIAGTVDFAAGTEIAGSDPVIKLTPTSKISGQFLRPAAGTNGWQLSWVLKMKTAAASQAQVLSWGTTNGLRYTFLIDATKIYIQVLAADRITLLINDFATFGTGDPAVIPVVFRIRATVTGGTVSVETAWYAQGSLTNVGITSTFAGTSPGDLVYWTESGSAVMDGATFGHLYATAGGTDNLLDASVVSAFNGFTGERAADRFTRLCGYYGIQALLVGNASDTQPMGPQKSDRLIELLKEISRTEDGPIFDAVWRTGIYLRTRVSMLNQTAKLTLTKAQCAPPLKKTTDDLVSGNRVTARNRNGSQATYEITAGPGSTADAPNGVGLYEQTVDVNVAKDDDLDEIAGRWAYKLSDTTARYSAVTVDLDAWPSLEAAIDQVDIGDRIVLSDVKPGGVGLIVLGYSTGLDTKFRRRWTAVCAPDTLYNPAIYDDTNSRYDSASTTLAVARDAVQTAWSISSTDPGDAWSTATPYSWIVDGETMTVTFMSAAAGTGPYTQTATVTRGTNGIAKAHAVGAEIHVYPRVRYG